MALLRVVITGQGAMTAAAENAPGTAAALAAGRVWPARIETFDLASYPVDRRLRRYLSRAAGFGAAAALEALASGDLARESGSGAERGAVLAFTGAPRQNADPPGDALKEGRPSALAPLDVIRGEATTATAVIAQLTGCEGPLATLGGRFSASLEAIGEAFHWIRAGAARVVVAGGCASIAEPRPPGRPAWAEGAAVLLLEERESALARGAPALAEVLAFASARPGAPLALTQALAGSGVEPDSIGLVVAAGLELGDEALRSAFRGGATPEVTWPQLRCGLLGGATGALNVLAAISTLRASDQGTSAAVCSLSASGPQAALLVTVGSAG
jgi:3-oxoacyl-[acyl-carrier-protein] synthase II